MKQNDQAEDSLKKTAISLYLKSSKLKILNMILKTIFFYQGITFPYFLGTTILTKVWSFAS